jgi:hypothetical protein
MSQRPGVIKEVTHLAMRRLGMIAEYRDFLLRIEAKTESFLVVDVLGYRTVGTDKRGIYFPVIVGFGVIAGIEILFLVE